MKRWQGLFITAFLLAAGIAYAVPSFTPTLDGIKDAEWGETPDEATSSIALPTDFNLDGGLYVTDDGQFIYFGFDADPDPWTDGQNPHIHILIDVGSTPGGGTYAAWGAGSVFYNQPFKPEFDVVTQWNTDDQNIQFTGLNSWSGTWVQLPEILTDAGGGGQWTEIALNRLDLGDPAIGTALNLTMWLRPSWSTNGGNCILPEQADFPSDDGAAANTIIVQFPYSIQTAYGDPTPPRLIEVRQIDRISVELLFDEAMNEATLGASGNYTTTGWPFTGFRYVTATTVGIWNNAGFVDGNSYTIELSQNITDLAGNPIDMDFDSATWTSPNYADVTFLVHDPGATQDSIKVKGSFNWYREFDAGWSGGNIPMNDNGLDGDAVADDGTYTLVLPMVPNGGSPDFEWGIVDENDGWILVGPNQSFSLPDATPITVEYTLPNNTAQDVTVTFNVDMSCVAASDVILDSVSVTGSYWGWGPYELLSDLGGNLWSADVLFPSGTGVEQEYKFRFFRPGGGDWEWESSDNRLLSIDDSEPTQVLPTVYFSDDTCSLLSQEVTVTFFVDMQCIPATIDSMLLVGSFNGWDPANPILMSDFGGGQYTADVVFPAGGLADHEYKYIRVETGQPLDWEFNNRMLTVPDVAFPVTLDNQFFNDWICPPADLSAIRLNDTTLRLQWNGPQRAVFQVWEHTSPDDVTVNGTLLDTVSDMFYDAAIPAGDNAGTFYAVIAANQP